MRPAVANDGGDITFRGFKEGIVYLDMKGACAGCPSSTATLQHGIQNLLRHFVPDVVDECGQVSFRGTGSTGSDFSTHGPGDPDRNAFAPGMTSTMRCSILAIDTALENCAAALLDTDSATILASEAQTMARGHAEALMPLIARVMDAGKMDYFALDRIAVTTGPGSFTGLRVGISAARGIGLAAEQTRRRRHHAVGLFGGDRGRRAAMRRLSLRSMRATTMFISRR